MALLLGLVVVLLLLVGAAAAGLFLGRQRGESLVEGSRGLSPLAAKQAHWSEDETEFLLMGYKLAQQHGQYIRAAERARTEGRLLVVIGNPTGGWQNSVAPAYGCGDVCIDLFGCEPCPAPGETKEPLVLKGDVLAGLRRVPTDSAVVFESETLIYPEALTPILAEIARVTGGDQGRVFAVHVTGNDEAAVWRYHLGGERLPPPLDKDLERRRRNRIGYSEKTPEGLARRIIYRFPPRDPYTWVEL